MNMEKREKDIEDYNSHDLHRIFLEQYEQKHGKEYAAFRFIGYELKLLKSLLEAHDIFAILCGIVACIKRNPDTVSIPYFVAGIRFYLPDDDNPELQWKIMTSKNKTYIDKWRQLRLLKAKWLPKATDRTKMIQLEKDLMECVDAKNTAPKKKTVRVSKSTYETR